MQQKASAENTRWRAYADMVEQAMNKNQILYVQYSGGSKPKTVRAIAPKYWIKKFAVFVGDDMNPVKCTNGNVQWEKGKTYIISKFLHAQEKPFSV